MLSIIGLSFLLAAALFAVALFMALRGERLALSVVIGDALTAIGGAPLSFAALALATAGVPGALAMAFDLAGSAGAIPARLSLGLVGALLGFAWYQLGMLAMIAATLDTRVGGVRAGRALVRVLPLVPQAMIVSLFFWIAVGIALSLFVVPGVILACMWMLVLPVMVAERRGLFATFSRSAVLTRGARWQLFLLVLIGFSGGLAVQLILAGFAAMLGGGVLAQTVFLLSVSLLSALPPALVASAYRTLVTARKGAFDAPELKRIFA